MSTPSTATLQPHHSHYGYSHHQNYQSNPSPAYNNSNAAAYRANASIANGNGRLAASQSFPGASANLTSTSSASAAPSRSGQSASNPMSKQDSNRSDMPVSHSAAELNSAKKRQRSRQPDWGNFYKNGLPQEVIVIDDSPPPRISNTPDEVANGASRSNQASRAVGTASTRHAAKKRKRDDAGTAYDPVYQLPASHSNTHTPHYNDSSASTISTDRTTSAIHTTAATSLGSQHSNGGANGTYQAGDVQPGQKRKRVATRQQIANEAKRREVEVHGDAYSNYRAPPRPPIKCDDVKVTVIPDNAYSKDRKLDDDDGHYVVVNDTPLTDRYHVLKLLGQGTFGKVVQAKDKKDGAMVAVKIIRSVQKYRDASRIELRVLSTLKANDRENRNKCIHLRGCFDFRGHICIVTDLLGQSIFDFLKSNSFVPFPNSQIQSFARQLFTSVAFLHDLNLIHTDLKPENILLCSSAYQTFTYNRKIPSSSTTVARQAAQRRVLLDTDIRLIDFGSATFQDEYHSSVVSTRHYRAPEIILGLGWSFPCDIWSIGCILVEFFTGDALFQTHDNLEHLAMMEAVCDMRFPSSLVQQVNKMSHRSGGNPAAKFFKRLKLDYPTADTSRASRRFVRAMKKLPDIIPPNSTFAKQFLDLLKKIFVYDPSQRITAKQALQHPWFKELAIADDGSEAARIKREREEEAAEARRVNGYR